MRQVDVYIKKRNRLTDIGNKLVVATGKREEKGAR